MIPKKIHYCWFGGANYPELAVKCMESWHKYLSEYELILWNENNFDVTCNKYVHQAYNAGKWAFVSDYARLLALYNHGGIYLDTDVEILKPIDAAFLGHGAFSGFENKDDITTGVIGAQKGNKWIEVLLERYNNRSFIKKDGKLDYTTINTIITETSEKYGFSPGDCYQILDWDVHIYPTEYFCPLDYRTGKLNITDNTCAIHYFAGSWHAEHKTPFIIKVLGTGQFAQSLNNFFRNNRLYQPLKSIERDTRKYIKRKFRKLKNSLYK